MPFWGLVLSSCTFIIPTIIAFRKRRIIMGRTCGILTMTSILYHGTQHHIFKLIDICYAHTVAMSYSVISIYKCIRYRRLYDIIILTGVGSSIYIFYIKSCNHNEPYQEQWHMVMHFISQSSWVLHALDSKK